MPYELVIEERDGILRVTATGSRSLESVLAMSKDILKACVEMRAKKVLIDTAAMEGRLSTMEAYKIVDKHFPKMRNKAVITHAAIVVQKESEGSGRFFETVAVNRGFAVRVFTNADKALEWLRE